MENKNTDIIQEVQKDKTPKKSVTVFLIISTMMLSLALVLGGVYSLYVSIGFSFLRGSAIGGINTASLYTYSNSAYSTGGGSMVWLIIISLIMLGLGVAMGVIFFKQLPLYKQIKLIAKMPNVKYKQYSSQVKKSVITFSIIGYIVCIGFCVFAIFAASRQPLSTSYKWIVLLAYAIVLALSISSMVLMFVKLAQLSKIKKQLTAQDERNQQEQQANLQMQTKEQQDKKDEQNDKPEENKQAINNTRKPIHEKDVLLFNDFGGSNGLVDQQAKLISQMSQLLCQIYRPEGTSQTAAFVQPGQVISKSTQTTATSNAASGQSLDGVQQAQSQDVMFETGVFELSSALQKLREIHISGLIDGQEFAQIRQKWINAMLKQPLFNGNRKSTKTIKTQKSTTTKLGGSGEQTSAIQSVIDQSTDVAI